ncbi:MAG: cell filamentation protein Fic [Desulfovibrio sp.]|nr:cell filamentation protein Fic [Desulfovibrio sp.]|tara:strand:+ start:12797 stop:13381 length:585 start_codon:yes stop_codon:yes gene_type:complete
MTTRYAHRDAYTYHNSSVLKSKGGHKTQEALDKFERLSVANRMMEDPPAGKFDYAHLKSLHLHLFQDVYDWAGEERNVSISKGNTQFANPRFIENVVTSLLKNLSNENKLKGLSPQDFVERAAHYVLELNMAHPFREGNGRCLRYFLSLLAQNAGFDLDVEKLTDDWLAACIEGVSDEAPMCDLIAQALIIYEN